MLHIDNLIELLRLLI